MLYSGYMFEINQCGLIMSDKDGDMIQLKNTPLEIGDSFTLQLTQDGRLFFKRTDIREELDE
jgi:hypothetical protein